MFSEAENKPKCGYKGQRQNNEHNGVRPVIGKQRTERLRLPQHGNTHAHGEHGADQHCACGGVFGSFTVEVFVDKKFIF